MIATMKLSLTWDEIKKVLEAPSIPNYEDGDQSRIRLDGDTKYPGDGRKLRFLSPLFGHLFLPSALADGFLLSFFVEYHTQLIEGHKKVCYDSNNETFTDLGRNKKSAGSAFHT